jgi:hypothetical protein
MNVLPRINTVQPDHVTPAERHAGPNLGVVATLYVVLFLVGLTFVTVFVTRPSFPPPEAGPATIVRYFQIRPENVRISTFITFGSIIFLGIFAAGIVSRFRFLGVRSAWVEITFFAGLATAFAQTMSQLGEWALTWPGIAPNPATTLALYYLLYGLGGPGFSVPMGLFVGSICWIGVRSKLLPGWIVWSGFVISIIGLVSWLNFLLPIFPSLPTTIPLTRFPSFVWLIATGFVLPKQLAAPSQ